MSIDVNVQNDLVIVTESSEDITVNVSNAAGPAGVGVPVGGTTGQVLKKLSNTNYDTYWALDGGGVPYSGATGQVDLGNYDLKVQGLTIGKGNNSLVNNTALGHSTLLTATTGNFNTAVGYESLRNTTTGQYNTAVGQSSLFSNNTGGQNTALGLNALLSNTSGSSNVAVGLDTLQHITTGSSNTAIGYNAGSHITGGSTPNTTATNSVFIGRDSKANADGQTNQIVIGQNAVGNGSNTATFGNTATTANYFTGSINGGSFVKSGGTSSQFLKADGSVDSTTYVGGSGTSGQVAYWNGTSSQTGSNNLFWDAANSRLGIGTNSPVSSLDVNGISVLRGSSSYFGIYGTNGTGGTDHYIRIPDLDIATFNPGISFYSNGVRRITLYRGGNDQLFTRISGTDRMALFGTGNLLLQNGGTFTDGGQRLQVQGDAFIKGSGATSGTIGLQVQDSGGANMLRLLNDTTLKIGSQNVDIFPTANGSSVSNAGRGLIISTSAGSQGTGALKVVGTSLDASGNNWSLWLSHTFGASSGTATHSGLLLNQTINQTGGANGITRGLYVNPTLTAAADWRSIEWSNNSGWGLYGAGTANNYLGGNLAIGTTTPNASGVLHVDKSQNTLTSAFITNSNTGTGAQAGIRAGLNPSNFGIDYISISILGTNFGTTGILKAKSGLIENFGSNLIISNYHNSEPIIFATSTSRTERMRLTAAGRLLLGTTSEGTEILKVQGTTLLNGGTSVTGSVTAVSNNGRGVFMQQTIVASANGDFLTALLVTPTFTLGAFTGVTTLAARFDGDVFTNGGHTIANKLSLSAGTTSNAQINLASSTAPTSPNNGDIWFDGTDLKMRIGGVTKTFTLV